MEKIFNKVFFKGASLTGRLCFVFLLASFFVILLIPQKVYSQTPTGTPATDKKITGVVKSDKGELLPGAVVNLEGTMYAAVTDEDGKFSLIIPVLTANNAKIVATLVGMEPTTVLYNGKTELNIVMKEKVNELNEFVITGYQNVDRRDMVGAHETLKADDIKMPNYTSIDDMLQGQVAGMIVTNSSTRVGSAPTITLRGTSSLLGTTSPLWVVDGIIQDDVASIKNSNPMLTSQDGNDIADIVGSSISWLNPNDIETITVLKDASATAIYGSRASNGVIVITTKKGKAGKLSVNYTGNMTVGVRPTYDNYYLMNSQERINFSREAVSAGAYYQKAPLAQMYTYEGLMRMYTERLITEEQFVNQYQNLETVNTDWLDLVTRTTVSHNHNLSLSGGGEKATYNASFNYSNREGTEIGNGNETFSGRLRLGFEVSPRIKVDLSLVGTMTNVQGFAAGVNPLSYATTTSRAIPAYDDNGEYLYYQKNATYSYNGDVALTGLKYNILNEMENTYTKAKTPQINGTLNADWDILGNGELRYNLVAGYTTNTRTSEVYADENTYYIASNYRGYDYGTVEDVNDKRFKASMLPYGGSLYRNTTGTTSYNIQNKLMYSKTFNKSHRFNAMAAIELRSTQVNANENTILGYLKNRNGQIVQPPSPSEIHPADGGDSPTMPNSWSVLYKGYKTYEQTDNYLSAFASFAYSYNHKYVFNFSLRNDASNRFGQDINNRFDPTYSFGVSWRATEENFMDVVKPYISTLSFRATYGIQGNVLTNISPNLILQLPSLSTDYNQFVSDIASKGLPNPFLDWERTKTWNWGTNIGLFKDKVTFDIDGYLRNSKPLSLHPLTPEYGGYKIAKSGAQIQNSGIEVTARFNPIAKKDIKLGVSVNFSKNWNSVKSARKDDSQSITTASYLTGNTTNDGIVLEEGYSVNGFWVYDFDRLDPETGYPLFNKLDVTDFNSIADLLTYAGSKEPLMSAGININFSYKQFSLNTGLSATLGGKTLLPDPYFNFYKGTLPGADVNLNKELNNRWRQPGDEAITNIPGLFTGGNISVKDPSGFTGFDMYQMWARSDARLVSKSFLRCRQIALSWRAPYSLINTLGVSSLAVTGTVSNIFTIASSKYKGMDPETGTSIMPRSFSLGLNVSF